jgi:hypothetical protein
MTTIIKQRRWRSIVYNYDALSTAIIKGQEYSLSLKEVILVPQINSRRQHHENQASKRSNQLSTQSITQANNSNVLY